MNCRAVEAYPGLVTEAVLGAYVQYLFSRAASTGDDLKQKAETSSSSPQEVPQSLEESLAPLELIYGKTALSAIGIVLHGAEPVVRYVEETDFTADDEEREKHNHREAATVVDNDNEGTTDDEESDSRVQAPHAASGDVIANDVPSTPSPLSLVEAATTQNEQVFTAATTTTGALPQQTRHRGRCLYRVGEHTLFSPYYCPCSAYAYQSIQRQEVWCCKHLLALQLALRVEASGLPHDTLHVRVVPVTEFTQLLLRAL